MNVYNSLGSNYDLHYVLKSLLLKEQGGLRKLTFFLEKKYNGNTLLFYKARQAITTALLLSQLPEGSKVAINGFTCIAVVAAVKEAGFEPVFLDIEKNALNFSAYELEKKIKTHKDIKAVIIQNTLGNPCDIEGILETSKKNKLVIIEDLAHSIGVRYDNGKEAGTVGDFTVLSFSQDKVVDGVTGGALIIRNSKYKVSNQKQVGTNPNPSFQDKYYPLFTWLIRITYPIFLGKILHAFLKTFRLLSNPMSITRSELSDLHAMLTLEEFRQLEKALSHRRDIARVYAENLPSQLFLGKFENSINLRFPILVKNREVVLKKLENEGIYISDTWYDTPVGPKKYFKKSGYRVGECPNSEKISKKILNLPTHKNVSEEDALKISQIITKFLDT